MDYEILEANPVDVFRAVLRRRCRTQRGRAENGPGLAIRSIEAPDQLDAFVAASRARGGREHIVDLLCLDAGLRLGEATALRWEDCHFGVDGGDPTRAIRVRASRSRGGHLGLTKSGRERRVAMSRRLRTALLSYQLEAGRPSGGAIAPIEHVELSEPAFQGCLHRGRR